jgi:hypothetical protein
MDHENLAFYDSVLEYAYKYEYWHSHILKGTSLSPDLNILVIQKAGTANKNNNGTGSSILDKSGNQISQQSSSNNLPHPESESSSTKPTAARLSSVSAGDLEANKDSPKKRQKKRTKAAINNNSNNPHQLFKLHTVTLETEKKKKSNPFGIQAWQIDNAEEFQKFNKDACSRLVAEFFAKDAPQELNINGGTRSYTVKSLETGNFSPNIFRKALEEVIVMISTNSFARFKKQAVLTNIGEGELSIRLTLMFIGLVIVIVLVCYFHIINPSAPFLNRLSYMCGFGPAYAGLIQYRYKFCLAYGKIKGEGIPNCFFLHHHF